MYASTNEYNNNEHKDDHPSGATKIRFIIVTNLVKNSNNRGRMVISDIDYRYGFLLWKSLTLKRCMVIIK